MVVLAERPLALGQSSRSDIPPEAEMLGTIHGAKSSVSPAPASKPPNGSVQTYSKPASVSAPVSRPSTSASVPFSKPLTSVTTPVSSTPSSLTASGKSPSATNASSASSRGTQTASAIQAASGSANLILKDEQGNDVKPSAVLMCNQDLLFLSPNCLWICKGGADLLHGSDAVLTLHKIDLPKSFGQFKYQELSNFVNFPAHNTVVILDKSGDLYEFSPASSKWQLFRANLPFLKGQPDPEFIDLSVSGKSVNLLDPERNQVWRTAGGAPHMDGYLKDILPWRIKPGDTFVGDGLSMAGDDSSIYVLKKFGNILKFNTTGGAPGNHQVPFNYKHWSGMRPSRLINHPNSPLYVVERENNRVIAIDKTNGSTEQFIFPKTSDLRGLMPVPEGFWILNNGKLQLRKIAQPDSPRIAVQRRATDDRLDGFIIPIKGVRIPRHVGVFPGARRLYRFGIHEGMDFFADPASRTKVAMGTPIRAAEGGKVLRVDSNFKDMTYPVFNRVMNDCYREHRTSDKNEDLFRGCQVWISHGNGLITRYAHCNSVNPALRKDQNVNRGDLLAFVGVSGTGQNLPGRTKYPHLHFEIWLDGKYLGWGLTPAETMGVYEDIFGNGVGE